MSRIVLTDELRHDYQQMFATCVIHPQWATEVNEITSALVADRERYQTVSQKLNVPWFVVAVLHASDAGRDFSVHPHNGDPLTERTRHLPNGRPVEGEPPFCWEDSAADALRLYHFDLWRDWSIAGILFLLEGHGGWGYRLHHSEVPSPYLWNYSTHYIQGKYVTDDTWSETSIAQRCGAAVLLRRLVERDLIELDDPEKPSNWPLLRYAENSDSSWVEALQRFMNTLPGIYVKVDGLAGPRTSDAFYKLTGWYLLGDPRSES
jgi:lysozyme family protein